MKKVKITVLKTMFNQDLADEYGVEGLSTHKAKNFWLTTPSQKDSATKPGKPSTNTFLPWPTAQGKGAFTMAIG